MEDLLVASSAVSVAERKAVRPVGLRHAYRDGDKHTLCGLTVGYLYPVEKTKWSPRTPQRCTTCDARATTE